MKLKPLVQFVAIMLLMAPIARASRNGLALTPPMGWNSWYHYGCGGLNETGIKNIADAMASSGMRAAGYQYVNLDDCWMATSRDANGNLIPDPTNFPSGMPALVSYIHNLGLKIGLYEDAGTATCSGRPGLFGHYQEDANTFAAWNIDYIKVDWCNYILDSQTLDPQTQYNQFSQALANSGRNMVFSICDWGRNTPWTWAPSIGNLWRTTPDIRDEWPSVVNNMEATSALTSFAGPGAWNDPDMLQVGNGGMTDLEYRTQFSMWAVMAAPLIASADLTAMSATSLTTLTNPEVIAVDQDALGLPGLLLSDSGSGLQVWSREVTSGTIVALLNLSGTSAPITANWGDIGVNPGEAANVRDLWAHADLGNFTNSFTAQVPPHGVTLIKVAAGGSGPAQTVYAADASGNTLGGTAVVQSCASVAGGFGYSCQDGNDVGSIGNGAANFVTINDVNAASDSQFFMTVYASVNGTRTYFVSVNDDSSNQVSVTGTSSSTPSTSGATIHLNAGANHIQFSNPDTPAPDLDHIVISPAGPVNSGFNIVYPIGSVSVSAPGQMSAASIALIPTGGFTGNISLSCVLPAAMTGAGCSSPGASLSGTAASIASLTITTTSSPASGSMSQGTRRNVAQARANPNPETRQIPPSRPHSPSEVLVGVEAIPVFVLVGLGIGWRNPRRRRFLSLLLICIVPPAAMNFAACGRSQPHSRASCNAIPNAPTALTASGITSSEVMLSWSPVTAGLSCVITGYRIYRNNIPIGDSANSGFSVTGLSASTTYSFSVAAIEVSGTSAQASPITVTTASSSNATPPGVYHIAVVAASIGVTRYASFDVTVQ
jgi:alpha-galactosidase